MTMPAAFMLRLTPEFIVLKPGVDIFRDGDFEYEIGNIGQGEEMFCDPVAQVKLGHVVEGLAVRPVPETVRMATAELLSGLLADGRIYDMSRGPLPINNILEAWLLDRVIPVAS